jgi:hypothetical protein
MAERQNRVKSLEREEMEIEEDIHNLLGMEILRNLESSGIFASLDPCNEFIWSCLYLMQVCTRAVKKCRIFNSVMDPGC